MNTSILVVDDEQDFLESVRRGLISSGLKNVRLESDPQKVVALLDQGETFDIALIDVIMPGMGGVVLLEHIKNSSPDTECLMVTAVNEARVAVECLKKGAYDYLLKPISRDDLIAAVKRGLEKRRLLQILNLLKTDTPPELTHKEAFRSIVTRSDRMRRILKEAELHAVSDVPVLITGESGTGKELLARAIHLASPRARYPFTPLNMVSLPGSLFEAEFFGYTRGAFTGAERDHTGYLEHTSRGTLFLDEIGDLPLDFQGKLLRVLQEGEYFKLGVNKPQRADIRFIAATNKDLEKLMAKGIFRKDLYYRLKGAWLHLPPLKERKEDLLLLIKVFLEEMRTQDGSISLDEGAMRLLLDYDYPGNVRELKSVLQSAVNLAQGGLIDTRCLPSLLATKKSAAKGRLPETDEPVVPLDEIEKDYILKIYHRTGKNKTQTAELLNIGLNTLRRKLEAYGVD